MQLWDRLILEGRFLKRRYESLNGQRSWTQFVVPHMLREEIMQELYAGFLESHLGEDKTAGKVHKRFYWPGMQQDVAQWREVDYKCSQTTASICTTHPMLEPNPMRHQTLATPTWSTSNKHCSLYERYVSAVALTQRK